MFVAVAQHLSLTRAADVLGVSASAVSMQIKALEDYLRVPLLRREGRQVELTAEGARLLPPVERALREASKRAGVSQSDLIRKGIRTVTAAYRKRPRPLVGWLKLSPKERDEIVREQIGDVDQ